MRSIPVDITAICLPPFLQIVAPSGAKQESDKAIEDCNEAIRIKPNYALAFFNRGNASFAIGQYDRAIEDYDQSIRLNSNDANAFSNRGNTYANKGQYDRGIEDYNEAIRLNPKHADCVQQPRHRL